MNYEPIPGLIFVFTQDSSGYVTTITTPDIPVGPFIIPSYVFMAAPATTVAGAEEMVRFLLTSYGLLP